MLNIKKLGDQNLLIPSKPVTQFKTKELASLIEQLKVVKKHYKGVGLAAPQIGINERVIIFGFEEINPRYPDEQPIPETILINPYYHPLSDEKTDGIEGCLSLPGLRGILPRYKKIEYHGYDINGKKISGIANGFAARIIQHEIDHLDGVLFMQKITDFTQLGYEGSEFYPL